MGQLDGKAALVTGGSRGIGAAVVRRLAADGDQVTFTYASSSSAADEVVSAVKDAGGQAVAVQADQSDVAALSSVFDTASVDGGLDILVCNAAQAQVKPIADVTEDDFDQLMAVNLKGPYFAIKKAGEVLRDGGRIITVSTLNTALPAPGMTPLGRVGEPADVADVVAFLAGPDGRWLTGQNLRATGGLVL